MIIHPHVITYLNAQNRLARLNIPANYSVNVNLHADDYWYVFDYGMFQPIIWHKVVNHLYMSCDNIRNLKIGATFHIELTNYVPLFLYVAYVNTARPYFPFMRQIPSWKRWEVGNTFYCTGSGKRFLCTEVDYQTVHRFVEFTGVI